MRLIPNRGMGSEYLGNNPGEEKSALMATVALGGMTSPIKRKERRENKIKGVLELNGYSSK